MIKKEKLFNLVLTLVLFATLLVLTGCGQKNEEQVVEENTQNNTAKNEVVEEKEESPIKNGRYDMLVENQDEELPDEDIYLEINDNNITLVDGFAQITQKGTFEIKDNKLIGTYNEVEYFDQSTADMTTKDINDKIEFEILEDGSLKDNIGFGMTFDKTLYQGETYKLSQEYGDSTDWEQLYLDFVKNDLKEDEGAIEDDPLIGPFIALIDLNFDDIPELLYYDAKEFINAGDKYTHVYTIENGKVVLKTTIAIRDNEKFVKIPNGKLVVHYENSSDEPDYNNLKIIEDLQGKTISTYKGTHSVWLEDKAEGNSQTMTETEYNQILTKYFNNDDIEPEVLKTYTLMEDYTDEQKTNIFEIAVEEYKNK